MDNHLRVHIQLRIKKHGVDGYVLGVVVQPTKSQHRFELVVKKEKRSADIQPSHKL